MQLWNFLFGKPQENPKFQNFLSQPTKKLTNIHSANADVAIQLDPPVVFSLEQCLDFIEDDELLEITPESLRLRKKYLAKVDRVRHARAAN